MSTNQEDLRKELALLEELETLESEELAATTNPTEDKAPGFADKAIGFVNELDRQAGLTTRALAGGAAQIAEPCTEPVRYLLNKVLPDEYQIGNIETATDEALTAVGVPEPQGAVEEGVQSVGRFATGFGSGFGTAKADDAVLGLLGLSKHVKSGATTTAELDAMFWLLPWIKLRKPPPPPSLLLCALVDLVAEGAREHPARNERARCEGAPCR